MAMDWMMLDRFVYRRDDEDGGFPDESTAPLRATSSTSLGQAFDVAFLPAQPPAISRLYVRWPGGTTSEDGNGTDVVAAHRDLLLLRLTSIKDLDESPYRRYIQDHFICVASSDPGGGPCLQLKRLPVCTIPLVVSRSPVPFRWEDDVNDETTPRMTQEKQRVFIPHTVGLVRAAKHEEEEKEEFVVAQLAMISKIPGARMMEAEVCVFRSRLSPHDNNDDDDDSTWEVRKIPIQHKNYEYKDLYDWCINLGFGSNPVDSVVTFNNCICWVNYYIGGILFYEEFEEESPPKISYLRLPDTNRPFAKKQLRFLGFLEANRTVCVTAGNGTGGDVLKYITTIRTDGQLYHRVPADEAFYILIDTMWTTDTGELSWVQDLTLTCCSLWARNASFVPLLRDNSLMFPLVSMDDHTVANFMVSEESHEQRDHRKIRKVSVVMIDLSTETVKSVVPYINGDEDLHGQDADMVKEKSHLLKSFLPSEFPKFFNLTRDHLGHI